MSDTPRTDAPPSERLTPQERAEWLHTHRAPSNWLILTKDEVSTLKRELSEARETIADLEVRHAATMLHTQTIVDEANELRDQRDEAMNNYETSVLREHRMQEQRDGLADALRKIEEHYTDGSDTYEDWKAMGQVAREAIAVLEGGSYE